MESMSRRVVFLALVFGCAAERSEHAIEPSAIEPSVGSATQPAKAALASAPAAKGPSADLVAIVAREYKTWRLADDEFHWAPGLCRMPVRGGDHLSRASGAPHDSKLFRLWTYDIDAYGVAAGWIERGDQFGEPSMPGKSALQDVAQVLVKESFVAQPWQPGNAPPRDGTHTAVRDGKTFRPGDPIGLFVMIQLATPREDTDEGWIYGTVAPDGTVTSASDSGACRDCHAARPNRIFGIPRPPALGM
jgi:hypothetical protein